MRIVRIALNGFRNYEWETVELAPGTNVISGQNAQGKTNLLESVYMLSTGRSFRTRFDKELVGFGFCFFCLCFFFFSCAVKKNEVAVVSSNCFTFSFGCKKD